MSTLNANNAVAPRQVACKTANKDQVPVDVDVLRLSGTFKDMCDDLSLEQHDVFSDVFPVPAVSTRIFKKIIRWCQEHKGDPELVVEKDPFTQVCKWFTLTDFDKSFFDVPIPELVKLVKAANYLDIPRLYHYACQSVASRIKGKHPSDISCLLQQDCDISRAQSKKIRNDNPWLPSVLSGARTKNSILIPNEVLVTIFDKLPREELERLRLISTQFDAVFAISRPLRVVTKVEFGAHSYDSRFPHGIDMLLPDGASVNCPDYEDLVKRLKFSVVKKFRLCIEYDASIQCLSALLPVKSAWKNATVESSMACFPSEALFEFAFTQLFLCKAVVLKGTGYSFTWSRPNMRLPAFAECNELDIGSLYRYEFQPADILEWLEHEVPREKKWSEPRQMVLHEDRIDGGIDGLLTALKTAFSVSNRPKPYIVRIRRGYSDGSMNEALPNEKTHETLRIRAAQYKDVIVKRA